MSREPKIGGYDVNSPQHKKRMEETFDKITETVLNAKENKMKTDNIKIVRSALDELSVSHPDLQPELFASLISDADTALNSLYEKAALIEWLEGKKRDEPTLTNVIEMDLTSEDFHHIEFHNAQIEATLKYLRGECDE